MTFTHPNCDVGAEADQYRDSIKGGEAKIVFDQHSDETNRTVIEYVEANGDSPFIRYRLTLEPVAAYSEEEYEQLKEENVPSKAEE